MWQQIALGSALVLFTTLAHGLSTVAAMYGLTHVHRFNRTHTGRSLVISLLVVVMFLVSLVDAVLLAFAYVAVGAISDLEAALYFSVVTFTTLGYGDLTLDTDWRLLASFEAANGIIMFGWSTALVVAYVQRIAPAVHHSHTDASNPSH
jgi:F0F1-type ATP synthase membrane subunit c/vacuolar-type H+-ATPase subunit K